MSLTVLLAVLAAALLHATWNAAIKTGANKQTAMLIMTVLQGALSILVVIWLPFPSADVWPWLIASGVVHMFYQLFLAYAYEQGDLSRVYPIARGAAPMIVMIVSLLILPDVVGPMEYAGVALLGLGILLMAGGALTSGESRKLIPFALGSAVATAAYTVIDGMGARISGDPITFVCWLLFMSAVFYVPVVVLLRGPRTLVAPLKSWGLGLFAATASVVAYAIVVWAMTVAPIALVAALRETSILFAVAIGWLWFKEPLGSQKALAATLIIGGVVLTRL